MRASSSKVLTCQETTLRKKVLRVSLNSCFIKIRSSHWISLRQNYRREVWVLAVFWRDWTLSTLTKVVSPISTSAIIHLWITQALFNRVISKTVQFQSLWVSSDPICHWRNLTFQTVNCLLILAPRFLTHWLKTRGIWKRKVWPISNGTTIWSLIKDCCSNSPNRSLN